MNHQIDTIDALDPRYVEAKKYCPVFNDTMKFMDKKPLSVGPFLRFHQLTEDNIWQGSILFIKLPTYGADLLTVESRDFFYTVSGRLIETLFGYQVLRYDIEFPVREVNNTVTYTIRGESYTFHPIGSDESLSAFFYSCNGLSHATGYQKAVPEKLGGVQPLWQDVYQRHLQSPYHLMVGIGDQIYNDEIWFHVPELVKWRNITDRRRRESFECREIIKTKVEHFVFWHYMMHFSRPFMSELMACVPSVMIVDDHDFFNGYGSYPDALQRCAVFEAVANVLERMYLLFQHHTTIDCARDQNNMFGKRGYNFVKRLSNTVSLLGTDSRMERTRDQVIDCETWGMIRERLNVVQTEHLIVLSSIPMVFPKMKIGERILNWVSGLRRRPWFNRVFRGSGWYKTFGMVFGEPQLLDDMVDQWSSPRHIHERNEFIQMLQNVAKDNNVRVTIVAGDAHCCAVGKFSTPSVAGVKRARDYEDDTMLKPGAMDDHRLMMQIVTSAIGNGPPPVSLLRLFHLLDRPDKVDNETDARILPFFRYNRTFETIDWYRRKVLHRRNWCELSGPVADDRLKMLKFTLRVEMAKGSGVTVPYEITVPKLRS